MTDTILSAARCGELLYRILVEIRATTGDPARVFELADIAHNLPRFLTGRDPHGADGLRDAFVRYARRHRPQTDPSETEYVRLLDMTDDEFDREYRPPAAWPAPLRPVAAAG